MTLEPTSILIIIPVSENWSSTKTLVQAILQQLPTGGVIQVAYQDHEQRISALEWERQAYRPNLPESKGFLAPVLQRMLPPDRIILVNPDAVYDLDDWTHLFTQTRWAIVQKQTAPFPCAARENVRFFSNKETAELKAYFFSNKPLNVSPPTVFHGPLLNLDWAFDRTDYPMVCIPPLSTYLHLFPVTKMQYEIFLASATVNVANITPYPEFLQQTSPRISASGQDLTNYEHIFLSGLLPEEIRTFVHWMGSDYRLPTVEEWRVAWKWMADQETWIPSGGLEQRMNPTARLLWQALVQHLKPKTLLDVSVMCGGLLEWVTQETHLVATGRPRKVYRMHNPLIDPPIRPTDLARRVPFTGLRLIKRREV